MILNDTGWQVSLALRCYVRHSRDVDFSRNTREAAIEEWAKAERAKWTGQEFGWHFDRASYRLTLVRAVDSGD